MRNIVDEIRTLCSLLLAAPPDSTEAARYLSELKYAAKALAEQQRHWNKPSEPDKHQDAARQAYRSRESDSADAFAEGVEAY